MNGELLGEKVRWGKVRQLYCLWQNNHPFLHWLIISSYPWGSVIYVGVLMIVQLVLHLVHKNLTKPKGGRIAHPHMLADTGKKKGKNR